MIKITKKAQQVTIHENKAQDTARSQKGGTFYLKQFLWLQKRKQDALPAHIQRKFLNLDAWALGQCICTQMERLCEGTFALGTVYALLGFAPLRLSDNFENCVVGPEGAKIDQKGFQICEKQYRLMKDMILNLNKLDSNKNRK